MGNILYLCGMIEQELNNSMETCIECGSRVYNLGCINCNEIYYINAQDERESFEMDMNLQLEYEYQRDYVSDELSAFEVSENIRN